MMELSWIPVAITAYVILAGVNIFDRFVLREALPDPIAYAFAVGMAISLVLPLGFFVFAWPGLLSFSLALLSGFGWVIGVVPFFAALQKGEASRVIPAAGGLTTALTFALAAILLGEGLAATDFVAFALLFLGFLLVTISGPIKKLISSIDWRIVIASVFFAVSLVSRRAAFVFGNDDLVGFVSVFLILALGMTLTALLFFIPPTTRRRLLASRKHAKPKNIGLVLGTQAGGAVSGLLTNFAIAIGPVALVQAAEGIKYVTLFVLAYLLSNRFPKYFHETFTSKTILLKLSGTFCVVVGLVILILV